MDYRELHKLTINDAYLLPLMEEVQDRLAGAAILSKLDLQSGYWQLPVERSKIERKQLSLRGQEWTHLSLRGCLLDCMGHLPLSEANGHNYQRAAFCDHLY